MRALALRSVPILEDDYNRYLWDGAVSAAGLSPYFFPPAAVTKGTVDVPKRLMVESLASGGVLDRVNHPQLTTIYPPVAQAAFLLAHLIRPFSLPALRVVLLLADITSALLLRWLLAELALPASAILVYWWNPLLVRETLNAAHMDVLVVPLLLAAFGLSHRGRLTAAAAILALAVGAKLWPILLAPPILAPGLRFTRRTLGAAAVFAGLTAALLAPMASHAFGASSGVFAYAATWMKNGSLFPALAALLGHERGATALRWVLAAALAALSLFIARNPPPWGADLFRRGALVPAVLLLAGPTAFPWYFAWLLPFLTVAPGVLLLLTAVLPLYDLSFAFEYAGRGALFERLVVPLEWAPVWAAAAWSAIRHDARARDKAHAR